MNHNKYNTKSIIELAFMSAFIVVLILLTSYVPIVSMLGIVLLPIPITVIYLKQNLKSTLSCVFISIILTCFLINPITAIMSALNYAIVGLALGYCIKSEKTSYSTLIYILIASILSMILTLILGAKLIENKSIIQAINEFAVNISVNMNKSLEVAMNMYANLGAPKQVIDTLEQMKKVITKELIISYIPITILIYSFISSYINIIITNSVLKKIKLKTFKILPFTEFYISNLVGAILIAIISISVILKSKGFISNNYITTITIGLFMIMLTINGMASVSYFFIRKNNLSNITTILIIVATFLLGLSNIYMFIGFLEMICDFRKLDPYRIFKR